MDKMLKITQIRSGIGKLIAQKRTIKALGLKKMHASVIHPDSPVLRGMIGAVQHLVKVEEVIAGEADIRKATVGKPAAAEAVTEKPAVEEAKAGDNVVEDATVADNRAPETTVE
jgi:large subunit ribosomal protein L30